MPRNETEETKEIELNLKRKVQQPPNSLSYRIPGAVIGESVGSLLPTKELARLSGVCVGFYYHSKRELDKRALLTFQQEMLDDDQKRMTDILESSRPKRVKYVFKTNPATIGTREITSNTPRKSTWQCFSSKKTIDLARGLRRPESLALMTPFLDEHEELKEERAKCSLPKYTEAEEKIMQDYYIKKYCLPFIVTLAADTTIEVPWEMNPETKQEEAKILTPSQETIEAINFVRNELLPVKAIDLDKLDTPSSLGVEGNYPDMEQLCKAAVRAYIEHFNDFNGNGREWDRRSAYSIVLVGLIFTLLGPENAKKLCHGLYDWVEGSDVFFMEPPKGDQYKVSDKNNLYLYCREGKILYFIQNDPNPRYLPELKLPESVKFTSTPTKLTKCLNERLIIEVLKTPSQEGHTFKGGRILSPGALRLLTKDLRPFFRPTQNFDSGHGVNFVLGGCGGGRMGLWSRAAGRVGLEARPSILKNYFKQSNQCLENLNDGDATRQNRTFTFRK